jgi:hypothetical protein
VELRRPRIRNRGADELVDARLDSEQEVPRGGRDREERRVEAREGGRAGENAEVVDDVVDLRPRLLGGPGDEPEQPLVRVRLAEQVDRLLREDVTSDLAAVLLGQVVPKAREDDAVQTPILRRLRRRRAEDMYGQAQASECWVGLGETPDLA